MRRMLVVPVTAMALVLVLLPVTGAGATPPTFTTLQPGQPAHLTETVPIQIVLLGYGPDLVPAEPFLAGLYPSSWPILRDRNSSGIYEEVGLEYTYDYKLVYTDTAYEDALFSYLTSIGTPERDISGYDISLVQALYNAQQTNVLDTAENLVLDAVAVERWLVEHPAPGIDPARDTVVLVNWWGRDDFRFHTYRTFDMEAASDTGHDASLDEGTEGIAWGGTGAHDEETGFGRESRTWFHDLSAGPDWTTAGFALDEDFGRGVDPAVDDVMPPVWEYLTPGGARTPEILFWDLWAVTRFVAVNLFFTPSPLYPAYLNDHRLPSDIELDVTVYNELGVPLVTPSQLSREVGELLGQPVDVDVEEARLTGMMRRCFEGFVSRTRCQPRTDEQVYPPLANMFLAAEHTISRWRDGSAEHEAGAQVIGSRLRPPYLGIGEDNWFDGTQSGVFSYPTDRSFFERGVSPTGVLIHEYGHYFGLSHVHDGWDPGYGFGYSVLDGGPWFFAVVGDEVSSVMSYLLIQEDFSQFDLDNQRRWSAAAQLRSANAIAADVLASSRADRGTEALRQADAAFSAAQAALDAHDYAAAAAHSRAGYADVRRAADAARVAVPRTDDGWYVLPPERRHRQDQQAPSASTSEPTTEIELMQIPTELLGFRDG